MCAMCIVQEKKGPSNYPSNLTSLIRGGSRGGDSGSGPGKSREAIGFLRNIGTDPSGPIASRGSFI